MRHDGSDSEQDTRLLEENYTTFRDCVSDIVIQRLSPQAEPKKKRAKARKNQIKPVEQSSEDVNTARVNDAEELGEFIEEFHHQYIASELFPSLPLELQTLSYAAIKKDETLSASYLPPLSLSTLENVATALPPSTTDSLQSYSLLPPPSPTSTLNDSLIPLLQSLLTAYTTSTTTPPLSTYLPQLPSRRPSACEICARDWIPLTYHHLIPRSMHAKAVKRGWHEEWQLSNVAWLCRACHSFVHRVATNEELAREFWSVELLLEREDLVGFANWIGRVRWKKS